MNAHSIDFVTLTIFNLVARTASIRMGAHLATGDDIRRRQAMLPSSPVLDPKQLQRRALLLACG